MRRSLWVASILVVVIAIAAIAVLSISDTTITAARFSALRNDRTALRALLQAMPKGGDLHVHLSGAVYAESLVRWAAEDQLCIRLDDMTVVEPPCDEGAGTMAATKALDNQAIYDRLVNAMSMRWYKPSSRMPSGHDQFFAAFDRFGDASWRRTAEMTIEKLAQYEADGVQYAEFMATFADKPQRQAMVAAIGDERDFAAALTKIKQNGFDAAVATARAQVAATIAKINTLRNCTAQPAPPGCKVRFRYIAQVNRTSAWADVFVQTAVAAELARTEPWVVGLNFVGPEDWRVPRQDYADHMRMIGFLAKGAPVALHAGELWLGLVPPEDLSFHIRQAVEVAGARRIGHGVSLSFEPNMDALLTEMRAGNVAIEINLTSNDVTLGVRGRNHPLPAYLKAHVPVVLSTDDAGVSRIDLTNEYVRAARDYGLGYRGLKAIARNALTYSFLKDADKREELAKFEKASADFERSIASQESLLANLQAIIKATVGPTR
jgi:adenosine deaminase